MPSSAASRFDTVLQDLRYAARTLRKSPAFTSVAVLTLALGIGATTAIFSMVYGVLLRPLPYRDAGRIVRLWELNAKGNRMNLADPNFAAVRAQSRSLEGVAEYGSGVTTALGGTEPARIMTASVAQDFFSIMGVQPVRGRGFLPEEQRSGAGMAALVSYSYWKQTLGGTDDLASIRLKIDDKPAAVVGVLPPGFRFPGNSDVWVPRELTEVLPSPSAHNWDAIAKVRSGITLTQARAEFLTVAQRLKEQYGQDTETANFDAEPLREAMTSDTRPALLILMGEAAFLLLIACANVVNLMLTQSAGRERELSIRSALGAERSRLLRQFLTESLLLSVIGGGLGILLAYWGVNALLALAPANLPRLEDVSISLPVLSFSFGVVVLVSLALGVFIAVRGASADPRNALAEGGRGQTGALNKHRLNRLITVGQLASAFVLLVGAGLLGTSLLKLLAVDSGFRTAGVLTMDLVLPEDPARTHRVAFVNDMFRELRRVPGVEEVGVTNALPLAAASRSDGYYIQMNPGQISLKTQELIKRSATEDILKDPKLLAELTRFMEDLFHDRAHLGEADYVMASEGYFKTVGIPLLQGRLFDDRDSLDAPHVALVSKALADEKWPNESPLGRTVEFGGIDGDLRLLTIVGVVGDVRDRSLESRPRPIIYVNYRQRGQNSQIYSVVMRNSDDSRKPDAIVSAARGIVHNLNPDLAPRFRTLSEVYSSSLETRRFSLVLIGSFSATALLLALAGIYGVTSYSVAQRTSEIGIRMALGASTSQVLGMVLKQGAVTGISGVILGALGALALTRWLQSQLFAMNPTDHATFIGVGALLLLVSLAACWIPARRAASVDPLTALRHE
jgi:ABC-type antimicrobial peptide transport system permease subunit